MLAHIEQYSRVDSGTTDDGPNLITVPERCGQSFNVDGVDSLGAAVPVGRGVEGVTCSGRREDAAFCGAHVQLGRQNQIGAGHKGAVAVACLDGG